MSRQILNTNLSKLTHKMIFINMLANQEMTCIKMHLSELFFIKLNDIN